MNFDITVEYNSFNKTYDVCVVPDGKLSPIYDVICSCSTFENADWLAFLIKNDKGGFYEK